MFAGVARGSPLERSKLQPAPEQVPVKFRVRILTRRAVSLLPLIRELHHRLFLAVLVHYEQAEVRGIGVFDLCD